jgi:hypothetical protein
MPATFQNDAFQSDAFEVQIVADSDGLSVGTSEVLAQSVRLLASVFAAQGVSTVNANSALFILSNGSASGVAVVLGVGAAIAQTAANSNGTSQALAQGRLVFVCVFNADGSCEVLGVGEAFLAGTLLLASIELYAAMNNAEINLEPQFNGLSEISINRWVA